MKILSWLHIRVASFITIMVMLSPNLLAGEHFQIWNTGGENSSVLTNTGTITEEVSPENSSAIQYRVETSSEMPVQTAIITSFQSEELGSFYSDLNIGEYKQSGVLMLDKYVSSDSGMGELRPMLEKGTVFSLTMPAIFSGRDELSVIAPVFKVEGILELDDKSVSLSASPLTCNGCDCAVCPSGTDVKNRYCARCSCCSSGGCSADGEKCRNCKCPNCGQAAASDGVEKADNKCVNCTCCKNICSASGIAKIQVNLSRKDSPEGVIHFYIANTLTTVVMSDSSFTADTPPVDLVSTLRAFKSLDNSIADVNSDLLQLPPSPSPSPSEPESEGSDMQPLPSGGSLLPQMHSGDSK